MDMPSDLPSGGEWERASASERTGKGIPIGEVKDVMNDFPKHFDHATRERKIYEAWEASGAFRADRESTRKPFVIPMPPPNATGRLHIGHAFMLAIEDVMIRWRRMAGDEVLWVPGTDHASIATEGAMIRRLQASGMADPRRMLGRDGLLQKISAHVEKSRVEIRAQIRALGSSCDWSRERYTLDPEFKRLVSETFGRLVRDGLIYRGNRIANWDVDLRTTLSDAEIHTEERDEPLYFIQYGPLPVATYRPELRLGDTALAVHPEDEKYRQLIGREVEVSWPKGPKVRVKIVADSVVDRYFGLGVVGVTPAHDPDDFELAKRHGLRFVTVIDEDGRMTAAAGPKYVGLTTLECRAAFLKDLREAGLLITEKNGHTQKVRYSYRSGTPVEYLPKVQWFIDVNRRAVQWKGQTLSLREIMADAVKSGDIRIHPEYQEKTYFNWIDNMRDWCISRQVWWGHRVPVWYRRDSETYVGANPPEGVGWNQDPDTLDTWFSSALWSWSTLTDPAATQDLTLTLHEILARSPDYQRFHPATVLETGYDILFFWVARMILMTTYATGRVPFSTVYLHGLVRDKEGWRMSTSRSEFCIDPQDVIVKKGADTLRLALISRTGMGLDTQLTDEKVVAAQHFIDKVWNAARYVATYGRFDGPPPSVLVHPVNRWMRHKLDATVTGVTTAFDRFVFGDAAESLRDAFRSDFCDLYIEAAKTKTLGSLAETQRLLGHSFEIYLCLLHPFIPFVTEDLWSRTGHEGFLMQHAWPEAGTKDEETGVVEGVETLFGLVKAIRNWRNTGKVKWRVALDLHVWAAKDRESLQACAPLIRELANVGSIEFVPTEIVGNVVLSDDLRVTIALSSEAK